MKTTENTPAIPSAFTLEVLRRWREGDTFHFKLRIRNTESGQDLTTDYSGGCLAFMPATAPAWVRKNLGYRFDNLPRREAALAWGEVNFTPDLPGVLHSLMMDADAGGHSFADFCSEYGYDTDSRKALATWEACADAAGDFRRVARPYVEALQEALADY